MLVKDIIWPTKLIYMVTSNSVYEIDSPYLQDSYNAVLSWMVLHMGHVYQTFMFDKDMIDARWAWL